MNGPYPEITNKSFLAKLFFKTFFSLIKTRLLICMADGRTDGHNSGVFRRWMEICEWKHEYKVHRLHATWIKPEVVATKKYTGYLHYRFITIGSRSLWSPRCSYMWVFLALVWPCQLFVRLWYRVSDVLDLSLVSKRFGFWPHITHVIVLTFKEI